MLAGDVPLLEDTAAQDRFPPFQQPACERLANFREVEHNFCQLNRKVQDKPARMREPAEHHPRCIQLCCAQAAPWAHHAHPRERHQLPLAFPPMPRAMVVFGAGYGWEALAQPPGCNRLARFSGGLDPDGIAILDQLRAHLPPPQSFLMDRAMLLAHRAHWGKESAPARHTLPRLTLEKAAVYNDLHFDRFQPRLRLEQERVSFG